MQILKQFKIGIIGNGEIGQAIGHFLTQQQCAYNTEDLEDGSHLVGDCTLIHLCFPLKDRNLFQTTLKNIMKRFHHSILLLHTTIALDTLDFDPPVEFCGELYHCPMGGTHARITVEAQQIPMFLGPWNRATKIYDVKKYFIDLGYNTIITFHGWKETAAAKLFSVVFFGINIGIVQQFKLICDTQHINFDEAYTQYCAFDNIGNRYTKKGKIGTQSRPIFYPGAIEGKCVIQDIDLLYPFLTDKRMADWVLDQNRKFKYSKGEVKND